MTVQYEVPKNARFISTTNIFTATFNNPTVGVYNFEIPDQSNNQVVLTPLLLNTVYLLGRISIGADIPEGDFLDAINTIPQLTLRKSIANEIVYQRPLPIVTYVDDQELIAWVDNKKANNSLKLEVTGILNQTAALVGKVTIKIHVNYLIYAIENTVFYSKYLGEDSEYIGDKLTGAY